MTSVAVLSQPLRQREAAFYLSKRPAVRKLVVTRFSDGLDESEFGSDTTILAWSSSRKPPPSTRAVMGLGRVKQWARAGSTLGLRVEHWARAADWRLRYVDRLYAVVESVRDDHWPLDNPALVDLLKSELREDQGDIEIAVFDLFDLPAVISFSSEHVCDVSVR